MPCLENAFMIVSIQNFRYRHFGHFKNKNYTGAVNAERKYLVDINQKVVKHQKLTSLDIV